MISKKSQSAMEYLMTYGWAILVVLIALGALFYLGVFSPKTPNTGAVSAPFSYIDSKITSGVAGDSISIGASGVSGTPTFGAYTGTCPVAAWSGTFNGNGQNIITLTCPNGAKGDRYTGNFDITYVQTGSALTHTANLQYSGTME